MDKVLISGASGFVGKRLSRFFLEKGYAVTGLGTSMGHPLSDRYPGFTWVAADTTREGSWQRYVAGSDIVINLAGRSIFKYWTKAYKQAIYDSRIKTTRNIVSAVEEGRTRKLLTASAVGIYGDGGDAGLTEKSPPGSGFLAHVCKDWEAAAQKASDKGVKTTVMRFGVILGQGGGALSTMVPAFKRFLGGPLGSGRQWFPWIHLKDIEGAVSLLVDNENFQGGIFNLAGPNPVRQKHFARSLGKALGRPAFMPAPAFAVKTIMGELGASLLQSQRAFPDLLENSGYSFSFRDLDTALEDIFGK